jgi:hypothetical protein
MKPFDINAVVVLISSLVIGAITGALTLATGAGYPAALIAAGVAAWAVLTGLPRLMR